MTERIVIAGASGFIGTALADAYRAEGATVHTIGRSGDARWGQTAAITDLLDGADLVVGLAGKSVNCRYTPENRAEIFRSRLATTSELATAIAATDAAPPLWINASTATIYRHAEDRPMTESSGELGTGFSVEVAKAWEAALFEHPLPDTRRIALRMAIVLGEGSALSPLVRLARFGFGGPQLDGPWPGSSEKRAAGAFHERRRTNGHQRFSWVHRDDVIESIRFLRDHELEGPVNVSSPHPVDDRDLMATLRRVLGVPFGLPLPRVALELGSAIIHSETELLLKSRWVLPERLVEAGFAFRHPLLEPALRDILQRPEEA